MGGVVLAVMRTDASGWLKSGEKHTDCTGKQNVKRDLMH